MYVLKDYPDYFILKLLLKTGWCKQTHEFYTAIKINFNQICHLFTPIQPASCLIL